MLLHHARRRSRTGPDGQDRAARRAGPQRSGTPRSSPRAIDVLQAALARDQLGEYQAQAAIAALHADAPRVEDTDWVQIVEWYDELLRFADTPIVRLNRAVAVGEADGAPAGLAALAEVDERRPAARRRRRVPPREERRPRARRPPLRRRGPQRAEPRRARPPDAPGGATQPDAAPAPLIAASISVAPNDGHASLQFCTRWQPRVQPLMSATTTETLSRPPRVRASSMSASPVASRSSVAAIKDAISSLGTSLKSPSVHTRRRSPSTTG